MPEGFEPIRASMSTPAAVRGWLTLTPRGLAADGGVEAAPGTTQWDAVLRSGSAQSDLAPWLLGPQILQISLPLPDEELRASDCLSAHVARDAPPPWTLRPCPGSDAAPDVLDPAQIDRLSRRGVSDVWITFDDGVPMQTLGDAIFAARGEGWYSRVRVTLLSGAPL